MYSDHDHRGHYDYAREHHLHYDLAGDNERAHRRITALQDEVDGLRGQLADAIERIRSMEADTPQARQLQLEADQAAADLAESGYDRHGRDCRCPYCFADEPGDLAARATDGQVGEPQDICPETSDGYHCTHWQEGTSRCCACGLGPEEGR
jgi:hypothetical protein